MADIPALLKEIVNNFTYSKEAYRTYLDSGKQFRFACELKKYNTRIMELLGSVYTGLPKDLQPDADALQHHYQVWTAKWEALASAADPAPDDIFVFENKVTFPRPSAQRLEAALAEMNQGG